MSTTATVMQSAPTTELSWKPPWDARRDTSGILAGVGYDTAVMDRFFEPRPERALGRTSQVSSGGSIQLCCAALEVHAFPVLQYAGMHVLVFESMRSHRQAVVRV